MRKEEKRIIIIIVIFIILILFFLIWKKTSNKKEDIQQIENIIEEKHVDILGDGTKLNKSDKLKETKKVVGLEELEVSNIQLTYSNGIAVLLGKVKNTGKMNISLTEIELTLYDEKMNEVEKIKGVISPVKAGETVQLNMGVSADYANAYNFKIEKKK